MDDAVLSAGNLLLSLVEKHTNVLIITIFTEFGKRPINWDAQKYIIKSGHCRISAFSNARKNEDICAMNMLGAKFKHLDFIDGGFRKNRNKTLLYPTYKKLFSGTINLYDKQLTKKIGCVLKPIIKKSDILYAPLGIGNHADHIVVNQAAQTLPNKTYYWLDQPYASNLKEYKTTGYSEAFRVPHQKKKEDIIACYTSQVQLVFPEGIPKINEVFFENKLTL